MRSSQVDEEGFRSFLKRGGRSPSAVKRCLVHVDGFAGYLRSQCGGKSLDDADLDDLQGFVAWVEREPKASAKTHLWALGYCFEFTGNEDLHQLAGLLREQRITRTPFPLKDFRGVNPEHAAILAEAGIRHVEQMLKAGRTPSARQKLADETGVPLDTILEFVKLSDLARIPGIKSIRARLYVDAGVDTVAKMAEWDPAALRAMLIEFVERTGFDGIAPLPAEAAFLVARAKELPNIVEY
jgi:predicted flap endonuclease-1-like 5' DNA nuclease